MGSKLFVNENSVEQLIVNPPKQKKFDQLYSDKKLGSFVKEGRTFFRVFSPSAEDVKLIMFEDPEQVFGKAYDMGKDENGVWEVSLEGELYGSFYGYRVKHSDIPGIENIICLDPYAKAVTTFNTYFNPRRAIIIKEDNYDWEGDEWIQMDWRDLIIYEMHIRDMTEHHSSGAEERGT